MENKKIFIVCPISKHFEKNKMDEDYQIFIKKLYRYIKEKYKNVFLALEREKYGQEKMSGEVCTPLDYKEMKDTDILLAIPEDSMGVAIEIGWASAFHKNIILILDKKYKVSPLVENIDTVTNCKKVYIDTTNGYQKCLNDIKTFIK